MLILADGLGQQRLTNRLPTVRRDRRVRTILAATRRGDEVRRELHSTATRGELRHGLGATRLPLAVDRRGLRVQLPHDNGLLLAQSVHERQERLRARQQGQALPADQLLAAA